MKNNEIFYGGANSSSGNITFMDDYLSRCTKNIVLKNVSAGMKAQIFKAFADSLDDSQKLQIILHPGTAGETDAVISQSGIALVDSAACRREIPNAVIFDFGKCLGRGISGEEYSAKENEQKAALSMYGCLENAKKIHDDWEKIYIENIDFDKLNPEGDRLIAQIFKDAYRRVEAHDTGRFFGTMLPDGSKNYINELTEELQARIFIKGRPGTGKSTLLKKIRTESLLRGFDTQTYLCSFDSASLDMVLIPALGICIFDSTPPHELFPSRHGDTIFDIYDIAVTPGTDERFSQQLNDIGAEYGKQMQQARYWLGKMIDARTCRFDLYDKHTDAKEFNHMASLAVSAAVQASDI